MALNIQKITDDGYSIPVFDVRGNVVELTGRSAVWQIRSIRSDNLIHTFSSDNNNIVLSNNSVVIVWGAAESSAWDWKQANYGIELTNPDGKRGRLIQDLVILSDEVVK